MLSNLLGSYSSIIILTGFFLTLFIGSNGDVRSNLLSTIISFICVLIVFGLRTSASGPDTIAYYEFFSRSVSGYEVNINDPGFVFITDIIKFISLDPKYFILIITTIQFLLFALAFYLFGVSNVGLFIIIFLMFMPGFDLFSNTIRQGLALSFSALCVVFYLRDRLLSSIVFLALAASIHLSLISVVIIYLIKPFKVTRFMCLGVAIASLFIFISIETLNLSMIENLNSLGFSGFLGGIIHKLYIYNGYDDGRLTGIFKYYFFLISILPLMCVLLMKRFRSIIESRNWLNILFFYSTIILIYAIISAGTFSFRLLYIIYPITVFILFLLYKMSSSLERSVILFGVFAMGLLVLDSSQMQHFTFSLG